MKRLLTYTLLMMIWLQSCNFVDECKDCFNPPNPIFIKVVNDNDTLMNLITNGVFVKDSIKMWYMDNTTKKYVNVQIITFNFSENIIQSNATYLTIDGEPKEFYLYLNRDNIDTIKIQVDENYDGCCTSYQLESITFNGTIPVFDPQDYTFLLKKEVVGKNLK